MAIHRLVKLTGLAAILVAALPFPFAHGESSEVRFRFDFGPGKVEPGWTKVLPTSLFSKETGFGFEPGSSVVGVDRGGDDPLRDDFITAKGAFLFSVVMPEGNYRVKVTLGDKAEATTTTVKAESRRLMLEAVKTEPRVYATRTFTVNVRNSKIAGGGEVRLKPRELGYLHWDDKLTLEFNDARPCVCGIEIEQVDDAVTVFLAGDSTVTDQPREPWNSWGQMLTRFFDNRVAIANHAESGESLRSFIGEKRLDKIMSQIKPGDYLFMQFGHNDQKERGAGVGAFTTYKDSLKRFIVETRGKKAIPVLVTPMSRRSFGPDGKIANNLGDYPEAVRQAAKEENVPLIDLNAMSVPFYESLGVEGSKQAFVDNTHHNNFGSYELARGVVEGIKASKLDLARFLVPDLRPFDPAHPDDVATFRIPASPQASTRTPDGN